MYRIGKVMFVHRKQDLFLLIYVDDFKKSLGKKQAPMWKKLLKKVQNDEPTSFLDHVCLGCTQRECKPNEIILLLRNIQRSLNHVFLLKQQKNYQSDKSLTQKQSRGPATWRDMLKNALGDTVNWQTRKWNNFTQFRILAWTTISLKRRKLESVGEMPEVCSQIVLKCMYLARIGRPDNLWSVNKLARSVTKATQACDKRLARLISYIHPTTDCRQYCHVGNTTRHCRLGLF